MKVRPGTSNANLELLSVPGSSLANTVEFTTELNDSMSFMQNGTVSLNDAQHIIFNRMSFNSITISGQSGNLTIQNSVVRSNFLVYSGSGRIRFQNNLVYDYLFLSGINNRIEIVENKFQALNSRTYLMALIDRLNVSNGLYINNNLSLNSNQNICEFGIRHVLTSGNVNINGNQINNTKNAIVVDAPNSCNYNISSNRIITLNNNSNLTGINTGFNPSNQFQITNNYIYLTGNGRNTGLFLDLRSTSPITKQATLLYNSVIIDGSNGLNCNLYCPGTAPFRMRNNIFKNNNSSPVLFISNALTAQFDLDYNDYYSENGLLALYNGIPLSKASRPFSE
jgi:hypothetical protein